MTPKALAKHVNKTLFPQLSIQPAKALGMRTAARWLIQLGWRHSMVKKGIYIDGHERKDVVEYWDETFLLKIKVFQSRMATWELDKSTKELKRIAPTLEPAQKEIITQFQDESCFHANEVTGSAWLRDSEQPLRNKSRDRLIHVSDFVNCEDGRLLVRGKNGEIVRDARQVIYPGKNGDDWWDSEQLMDQVKDAIDIFQEGHPDKEALFVFDQSSAHASLPADAIRPFDMNKSNGGKQRFCHDTVIPNSNPDASKRGQAQKMTTDDRRQKGLQQVLEECGFNVKNLRAKCSRPVCPHESQACCMARLLSQQDDIKNQTSMLETLITEKGHHCIFLPKFHCELNPIEMVS